MVDMNSKIQGTDIGHHSPYWEGESMEDWAKVESSNCKLCLILTDHVR